MDAVDVRLAEDPHGHVLRDDGLALRPLRQVETRHGRARRQADIMVERAETVGVAGGLEGWESAKGCGTAAGREGVGRDG